MLGPPRHWNYLKWVDHITFRKGSSNQSHVVIVIFDEQKQRLLRHKLHSNEHWGTNLAAMG
jgi:hypothetical protein